VRKVAALFATLALVVAACGAPLIHVHESAGHHDEGHHHGHHGTLVHVHDVHQLLHAHRSDGVELENSDEEDAANYLDVLKAKIADAPALLVAVSGHTRLEQPAISLIAWQAIEPRNHDPPWTANSPERAPPA
jgi:hypothetical protein